jgi:DNA processing protein
MSVEGDFAPCDRVVAIVGSRHALPVSIEIARSLATTVAHAGGVVVSGGANGVDAAAHTGAVDARGRTWAVLGCGAPYFTPSGQKLKDKDRFARILNNGGCIIRPFPHETPANRPLFLSRNRVTIALAHLVIVVQAGARSGSWSTATKAREMGRETWIVPGFGEAYAGSFDLIAAGAHMMRSAKELERWFNKTSTFQGDAQLVLNVLGSRAKHPDEIAMETGLSTPAVATALLTLALGDVVVEGSAGMFQRK